MQARAMCWKNGELMPAAEATVSVYDHGLLYGDGVFEGIRFYHGAPFRLEAHLARLFRSARAISLHILFDERALATAVRRTIEASGMREGYARLIVTRGRGPLGLDVAACERPTVLVIVDALCMAGGEIRQRGARLIVSAIRRARPDMLDARIKSLNYLGSVLARIEAARQGADEAVLLNARGHVAEGSADNIFIVRDGALATPPVTDGALEGVTRGVVMELAEAAGIPCREASLTPYDLYTADGCFLCGTGAELIPVRDVDGRELPSAGEAVFRVIESAFRDLIRRECGRRA